MEMHARYNIELLTKVGPAPMELFLEYRNRMLEGQIDGHFGRYTFGGGTLEGDDFSFTVKVESPLGEMDLEVTGSLDGDDISGEVKLGQFPPTPFKGSRVNE